MSEQEIQIIKERTLIVDDSQKNPISSQQILPETIKYQNFQSLMLKACILCLSASNYGYCLVQISTLSKNTMIVYFGQQSQNPVVNSFLIGILTMGGAVGSFMSPFFMKCFTRRYTMHQLRNIVLLLNVMLLIISGIIQIPNLYVLFVCRGIQGFIFGNIMAIIPVYINELSPKQTIGTFGVIVSVILVFGQVFSYSLGIVLTKSGVSQAAMWRIMFGFDFVPIITVILNCLYGFIPESPNSLIIKGEQEQAKRVINLFIKDEYVEEVFKQKQLQVEYELNIKKNQEEESLNYSKKAYLVGFLLPTMQQFTGIVPVATVIGDIIQQRNAEIGYYTPLVINIAQFIAIFGAIYVLNSFGRRIILLTGNFAIGICNLIIGIIFVYINSFNAAFQIVFAFLIIYMIIYGLMIGPIIWMYVPQIIPAKVVPFATTLHWIVASLCLIIAPIINSQVGSFAVFFIFGGITLIIGVINFFSIVQIKVLMQNKFVRHISEDYTQILLTDLNSQESIFVRKNPQRHISNYRSK